MALPIREPHARWMKTPSVPNGAVVVGVAGSGRTDGAVAWAAAWAARENRPLVLARAVAPVSAWVAGSVMDTQELNLELLDAGAHLVETARAGIEHAIDPDLIRGICTSADGRHLLVDLSRHAHLVVLGAPQGGRVRRLLLGSVSSAVVRRSHCPVVVVREQSAAHPRGGVVVGVDGLEGSTSVLEFGFRAASWQCEPLTVVHSLWEATTSDGHALAAPLHSDFAAERLAVGESLAGLREKYPDVDVTVEIDRGLAEDVLADLSRDASLVVVGSRAHGPLTDLLVGSVARALVEHAHCPVAAVPLGQRP